MVNQSANYYGVLLYFLVVVVWVGIFTSEPSITGFAVLEYSEFDVEMNANEDRICADGSLYSECSSLIKPKFCLNGRLTDYCELCGCEAGEVCSDRKCIQEE